MVFGAPPSSRRDADAAQKFKQRHRGVRDEEEERNALRSRTEQSAALAAATGSHDGRVDDGVADEARAGDRNLGTRVDVLFAGDEPREWYAGTFVAVVEPENAGAEEGEGNGGEDASLVYRVIFDDLDDRNVAFPSWLCRLRAGEPRVDSRGIAMKIEERREQVAVEAEARAATKSKSRKKAKVATIPPPHPADVAAGAALDLSSGGKHWQWPQADGSKTSKALQRGRKNVKIHRCVYLLAAPAGSPAPALTSPTRWVSAKPGAVLAFTDGLLMILDECYEDLEVGNCAMARGRLVLTRQQLADDDMFALLEEAKPPMPGINTLCPTLNFLDEEDAEKRELFLTAHEFEQPMDNLKASAGQAFFETRDGRKNMGKKLRARDVKKVVTAEYDSEWKPKPLMSQHAVNEWALAPVDPGAVDLVAAAAAVARASKPMNRVASQNISGGKQGGSVTGGGGSHGHAAKRHVVGGGIGGQAAKRQKVLSGGGGVLNNLAESAETDDKYLGQTTALVVRSAAAKDAADAKMVRADAEIARLVSDLRRVKAGHRAVVAAGEAARAESAASTRQLVALQAEMAKKDAAAKAAAASASSELAAARRSNGEEASNIASVRALQAEMAKKDAAAKAAAASASSELAAARRSNGEEASNIASVRALQAEIAKKDAAARSAAATLTALTVKAAADLDAKEQELTGVQRAASTAREQLIADAKTELDRVGAEFAAALDSLTSNVATAKAGSVKIASELAAAKRSNGEEASIVASAKAETVKLASELAAAKRSNVEGVSNVTSVRAELSKLASELAAAKRSNVEEASNVASAMAQTVKLASELAEAKRSNIEGASNVATAKAETAKLASELYAAERSNGVEASIVASAKAETVQLASELAAAKRTNSEEAARHQAAIIAATAATQAATAELTAERAGMVGRELAARAEAEAASSVATNDKRAAAAKLAASKATSMSVIATARAHHVAAEGYRAEIARLKLDVVRLTGSSSMVVAEGEALLAAATCTKAESVALEVHAEPSRDTDENDVDACAVASSVVEEKEKGKENETGAVEVTEAAAGTGATFPKVGRAVGRFISIQASPITDIQGCVGYLRICKNKRWNRAGPLGPKTLCDACGMRYRRSQASKPKAIKRVVETREVDEMDMTCKICGSLDDEDGVLCDGCDGVFHLACVNLRKTPKGDWFCDGCEKLALDALQTHGAGGVDGEAAKELALAALQTHGVGGGDGEGEAEKSKVKGDDWKR